MTKKSYLEQSADEGLIDHATARGLAIAQRMTWTAAEDSLVRLLYAKHGAAKIGKYLPGRSDDAIRCRAKKLGVATRTRKPWTLDDDATLIVNYGTMSSTEISAILGRTADAVLERARQIGARKNRIKP